MNDQREDFITVAVTAYLNVEHSPAKLAHAFVASESRVPRQVILTQPPVAAAGNRPRQPERDHHDRACSDRTAASELGRIFRCARKPDEERGREDDECEECAS